VSQARLQESDQRKIGYGSVQVGSLYVGFEPVMFSMGQAGMFGSKSVGLISDVNSAVGLSCLGRFRLSGQLCLVKSNIRCII